MFQGRLLTESLHVVVFAGRSYRYRQGDSHARDELMLDRGE